MIEILTHVGNAPCPSLMSGNDSHSDVGRIDAHLLLRCLFFRDLFLATTSVDKNKQMIIREAAMGNSA